MNNKLILMNKIGTTVQF